MVGPSLLWFLKQHSLTRWTVTVFVVVAVVVRTWCCRVRFCYRRRWITQRRVCPFSFQQTYVRTSGPTSSIRVTSWSREHTHPTKFVFLIIVGSTERLSFPCCKLLFLTVDVIFKHTPLILLFPFASRLVSTMPSPRSRFQILGQLYRQIPDPVFSANSSQTDNYCDPRFDYHTIKVSTTYLTEAWKLRNAYTPLLRGLMRRYVRSPCVSSWRLSSSLLPLPSIAYVVSTLR